MIASANETDFDDWILSAFAETGPFTMLFVLLRVEGIRIDLLRSAYLHVVGDELRWPDMVHLFGGAGVDWSGVVFFRAGREGLVDDPQAKARLSSLVRKLHEDRLLIRDGEFFNCAGLRLAVEEIKPH